MRDSWVPVGSLYKKGFEGDFSEVGRGSHNGHRYYLSTSSTTVKSSFHGTAISVTQHPEEDKL